MKEPKRLLLENTKKILKLSGTNLNRKRNERKTMVIYNKWLLPLPYFLAFIFNLSSTELAEKNRVKPYAVANVSEEYKFIWFRVPKVASTTLQNILKTNHIQSEFYCETFSFNKKKYKKYFKFAFVRNPWDRVVSCYIQKVKRHLMDFVFEECFDNDFDYFVDFLDRQDLTIADRHIRLQTALVPFKDIDFLGRFENFHNDLNEVMNILGIHLESIPQKNPSDHLHYSHYYNERTKQIIARKYKKDIEAFAYEFENQKIENAVSQ